MKSSIIIIKFILLSVIQGTKKPDVKYILRWTHSYEFGFWNFNDCEFKNCVVTNNRHYFNDVTRFDAVAFDVRHMRYGHIEPPKHRAIHQKYIFYSVESADLFPMCTEKYERLFNWTITYRFRSNVPFTYFVIADRNGTVVGPKKDMVWMTFNATDSKEDIVDENVIDQISTKYIAAAWFVSHCSTRSRREQYAANLSVELDRRNLKLDIYGRCGMGYRNGAWIYRILQRRYYFYLSFENSFEEDYVTEKVVTALRNSVVPIVYGGADYSRFLPPFSYLDARLYTPAQLAAHMQRLIKSPNLYRKFFWWRKHYSYHDGYYHNGCRLCAALNNNTMMNTYASYINIRKWWHNEFRDRCKDPSNYSPFVETSSVSPTPIPTSVMLTNFSSSSN